MADFVSPGRPSNRYGHAHATGAKASNKLLLGPRCHANRVQVHGTEDGLCRVVYAKSLEEACGVLLVNFVRRSWGFGINVDARVTFLLYAASACSFFLLSSSSRFRTKELRVNTHARNDDIQSSRTSLTLNEYEHWTAE